MPVRCATWMDHDWRSPVLVASGRHPVLGPYQKFRTACTRCPVETSETRWMGAVPASQELSHATTE